MYFFYWCRNVINYLFIIDIYRPDLLVWLQFANVHGFILWSFIKKKNKNISFLFYTQYMSKDRKYWGHLVNLLFQYENSLSILSGILFYVVTIVIRRTPCLLNAAVQSHVPLIITKMSFMMIYPRTMSQTNHLIVVLFSTPDNSSDNSPRGISNSSFNCFCSHSEVLFL